MCDGDFGISGKKYDYYNIANIARLMTELPDDDLKEVMFIIEYKRKRYEERRGPQVMGANTADSHE